jgi:hypothetical protein
METANKTQGVLSNLVTENDVIANTTDLFRGYDQEVSLVEGRNIHFRRLTENQDGPFIFNLNPQGLQYLHLSSTRLFIQGKIVDGEGKPIGDDKKIAPVNLLGSSMFSSIDISIDGVPYPELSNKYSNYKAYLETVLTYSPEIANGHLATAMFHMDTEGLFDTMGATNIGYTNRANAVAKSNTIQLVTPLASDFFQLDRLYPPGSRIQVTLTKAPEKFFLMSADDKPCKFQIDDMYLSVRHITVSPEILKQHQEEIKERPVILPYNKTAIQTYSYPAGSTNINTSLISTSTLPKTMLIGFVHSSHFNGSYKKNPFLFDNLNINYLSISVNGQTLPTYPYTPDFGNGLIAREYRDLFDNIGILTGNKNNMMTPKYYCKGMTLFAFDLTPDLCGGYHCHTRKTGAIDLDVKFATPLTDAVNVIVASTYDAQIIIRTDNKVSAKILDKRDNDK